MTVSSCKSYLVSHVMAATPQRLQLMLIEAAIRFVERARRRWRAGEDEPAIKAAVRAQQIVGEMLAGLENEHALQLIRGAASTYLLAFRKLTDVCCSRKEEKLKDVLDLLRLQQEAWERHPSACATGLGEASFAAVPEPGAAVPIFPNSAHLGLPAEA